MLKVEIVADSLSPQKDRLTSMLITFPRMILAEINTHRMLSKNTSSSRAIPFAKMVEAIKTNPFIPIAWQKAHSGMQGTEYFTSEDKIKGINAIEWCETMWLGARDYAVQQATVLDVNGVTKQLDNRLLEPFMWTTMLITGSESGWENLFHLRCPDYVFHDEEKDEEYHYKSRKDIIHVFGDDEMMDYETKSVPLKDLTDLQWLQMNKGQAEIHMMRLAEMIYDAMKESQPKMLKPGEYHIPFQTQIPATEVWNLIKEEDSAIEDEKNFRQTQIKISAAMAARTSYTNVGEEKKVDYGNLVKLHDRLLAQTPPHSSPLEHIGKAMSDEEYMSWVRGEIEVDMIINPDKDAKFHTVFGSITSDNDGSGWCRNFKGFIPYRHIVES